MAEQGLRELKKQATRKHISKVAVGLFLARGFDNVTVAEVAAAAGVSKMTVFTHFPRKEDMFLNRFTEFVAGVERVLAGRAEGESIVTALRGHQHHLLATGNALSGVFQGLVPLWRVLQASPALAGRMHEQTAQMREALTEALKAESVDPTTARLFATQITATMASIFEAAVDRILEGVPIEEVRLRQARVIDEAFDLLENGMGDYGARSRASMPAR
ncbi:TetR/AcrR family transcriptional regulator [Allokutzneria albata]|uniref:DNA-binding transcriptional regulator, AcrR family n=1 Tax=Allokutzneria albata TaxID=211114 RepID=A0A1H0DIA1_ALLAB|nr:TetR/AcrR family transcriptional regulator [Allokutzneria albata]SDN69892.1 DNA-binding transcriptional regulator, AcrR family [Allokutzneria albata]